MSTNKDTGGPAFPSHGNMGEVTHEGMDLRDYFAAKAIRPQPTFPKSLWQAIKWALGFRYEASRFCPEQYASRCYEIADAMLEARKS